jgi:hypothetical protein
MPEGTQRMTGIGNIENGGQVGMTPNDSLPCPPDLGLHTSPPFSWGHSARIGTAGLILSLLVCSPC